MRSRVKQTINRTLRHALDRIMLPYVQAPPAVPTAAVEQTTQVAAPAEVDEEQPIEFNARLHFLRTIELQQMPRAESVLLSVGCADRSYFDWLEQACGPIPRHVGVEFYRPPPEDLPGNVEWIVASASAMPQVEDRSVDVLFSGQNIEHLPPDALYNFLLEAHRVIKPGGTLVIDSPNRLVTEHTGWRHPEHTIELSPAEARALIETAGFRVDSCRGQWLCQDRDGVWLPLFAKSGNNAEIVRRAVLAGLDPDGSFCWWIEATVAESPVDFAALRSIVDTLFEDLWTMRVNRSPATVGRLEEGRWIIPAGSKGSVYRVGPIPLFEGEASIALENRPEPCPFSIVVSNDDGSTFATDHLDGLAIDETVFGIWIDVIAPEPTEHDCSIGRVIVSQSFT